VAQHLKDDPLKTAAGAPVHHPVAERRRFFLEVYDKQFTYVWNCLRRMGVPIQDLEDLAQEVFEDVFQKLHTYDVMRPIRPWLFGFAFHVVLNHRKSSTRRRETFGIKDGRESIDSDPRPDAVVELHERSALVFAALEDLEVNRRAVFVMADLAGHSVPEIADALAVPLNTAYSRLRLARKDFEAAVRRIRAQRRTP
jgi:RNA polymerase sigma-70 factor (ECF subfamily)